MDEKGKGFELESTIGTGKVELVPTEITDPETSKLKTVLMAKGKIQDTKSAMGVRFKVILPADENTTENMFVIANLEKKVESDKVAVMGVSSTGLPQSAIKELESAIYTAMGKKIKINRVFATNYEYLSYLVNNRDLPEEKREKIPEGMIFGAELKCQSVFS